MLKTAVIVIALFVIVPLVIAMMRPDTFRVERSTTIAAPAARVHGLINDIHAFNTWNPYNAKDPAMRGEYRGPAAGPGAQFHFEGNKDVGKGSVSIVDTAPAKVTMTLDMLKPFEGHNTIEFILAPQGAERTEVTWAMYGPMAFIAKVASVFMNMDKMIGRDFEAGLANLKQRAEQPA